MWENFGCACKTWEKFYDANFRTILNHFDVEHSFNAYIVFMRLKCKSKEIIYGKTL